MTASTLIRQVHRWLGILLTLLIFANFAVMTQGAPPPLLVYAPLAPLALLIVTGLYMFTLPYLAKSREARAR